jgi:hypothetical protein
VAVVTGIVPQRPAELAEVEGQIRGFLTQLKTTDALRRAATELAEKAKAEGGDLKGAAQRMGYEVKTTPAFGPDGAAEGIGSASLLGPAFEQPAGSVFGPLFLGGQQFVCKIAEKTAADPNGLALRRADIAASLKEKKAREQMDLFVDSVRSALIREGKIKIHQPVYDRVLAANRS